MATKPYDKGSANESVPALTDSGAVSYPVGGIAYGTEGGTVTVVGAAGLPVQAGSGASFPVTDGGGSLTVDGTVGISGSVAVTGPLTDTQLRANPVQVIGPSGGSVPINDGSNSLTVDTEGPSNPLYVRFSTGQSAVTQSSLDGITHSFGSDEAFPSIASYIFGYDYGTSRHRPLFTNSSGNLVVTGTGGTFPVTDNGGSLTVDGTVAATQSGTWTVTGSGGTFPVTDSGGSLTVDAPVGTPVFVRLSDGASAITTLPVSLASVPSHDVTNAGTFAVQVSSALPAGTNAIGKLAANSGVTIGAVEIAATQTLSTVTTVGTVTTLTGGGVAHDSADSGNPVKVGARAISSLASATMVAAADRTDAMSDLDGSLLVRSGFPLGDLTSERVSNTDGASTAFANFGATASVRNYVTAITIYNSSATAGYVDFRDGTSGSILFTVPIPAGSGAVLCNGGVPLFRTSAATALAYDVSAALTTV